MRVLIINRQERARSLDTLYNGVSALLGEVTVLKLSKAEIDALPRTLDKMDFSSYDRVLFDIPVRRAVAALKQIRRLPGLIYYEEDAYQEFMQISKFHGRFLGFFKALGGAPVIVTGYNVMNFLRDNGVNAHCVPKAYDDLQLRDLQQTRDIDVAFVGRVNNQVYTERKELLEAMQSSANLQLLRTETPDEYLALLNRIRCFFSADIGFNEYMAKNFEDMACGCLLMAKRQPTEDAQLGFVDMHNVVHYDSAEEALSKYCTLQEQPELAQTIAQQGRRFAEEQHRLSLRAEDFSRLIAADYPERSLVPSGGWWATVRGRLGL